ncbi:MAG: hypothetical protein RSP_08600 [Rhodanobacter sp.]
MPYAYTVVWCDNAAARQVLLATKHFTGSRFNGAAVAPPVLLHGAGQACFPGGQINAGEAPQAAAEREFLEETGIDLALPLTVATYHITNTHLINRPAFSTLYVKLAALADLNQLVNDINLNIGANTPLDQEHSQVQAIAEVNVAAALGPSPLIPPAGWYGPPRMAQLAGIFRVHQGGAWHQIAAGFVAPPLRAMVANELNAAFNWHGQSIGDLHLAAAAVPVVAAVLGGGPPVIVPPVLPPPVIGPPLPVAQGWNLGVARRNLVLMTAFIALGLSAAMVMYQRLYADDSEL